jgi:hypothetical protein|nr:MAG TPA: NinG recombination protein [Caudoviricetes sp.]
MMTHKICKSCGENLEVSNFTKSKNVKDGYENKCKKCRNKQSLKHLCKCETCGNEWLAKRKSAKYCSPSCKPQSKRIRYKVECSICSKEIERTKSQLEHGERHYCSEECKNKGYSLFHSGINSIHYNRKIVKCSNCQTDITRTEYEINTYEYLYCSNECRNEHYKTLFSGSGNPNYNPELDESERVKSRNIDGYSEWRRQVYERDKYTCQCCGDNKGGNLVAHHILNYSEHEELRTNVGNGITLCETCHKEFHNTYGYKNNTKEQVNEFIYIKNQQAS